MHYQDQSERVGIKLLFRVPVAYVMFIFTSKCEVTCSSSSLLVSKHKFNCGDGTITLALWFQVKRQQIDLH